MISITLARNAMATRFELVMYGSDAVALRAAGEEALTEIERIEAALSLFRPDSEIAHVNARAAQEPVRITPATFALLELAREMSQATNGAFDVTAAPLVRAWGFYADQGTVPPAHEIERACKLVGMGLVQLDRAEYTVRFARPGVMIDLGALGKGCAIEAATGILRDAGVASALLHGGTSTVQAIGAPPGSDAWRVAIGAPPRWFQSKAAPVTKDGLAASATVIRLQPGHEPDEQVLRVIHLKDHAVSVSAVWGKAFIGRGRVFGHIIDPRTGYPAERALLSAIALPSAPETDALSTALLVSGTQGLMSIARFRPAASALLLKAANGDFASETIGSHFG